MLLDQGRDALVATCGGNRDRADPGVRSGVSAVREEKLDDIVVSFRASEGQRRTTFGVGLVDVRPLRDEDRDDFVVSVHASGNQRRITVGVGLVDVRPLRDEDRDYFVVSSRASVGQRRMTE